ncbi:MAG: hypothetical protein GWP91_00555 [Rhodobacterales bacterium]|nr:hypothetical protein [Rhodobacterales bacterium]
MHKWVLLMTMAVGGCATKRSNAQRVDSHILTADRHWDARGEEGLELAESSLVDAWHRRGDQPEVIWRLVRLHVVRGLMESNRRAAVDRYAEARALGIRCLESSPAFRQRRSEASLRAALPFLDASRMPCVAWTALAWSRWMVELGGEAAAMDLDELDALIAHASASEEPRQRSIALWSRGLVAASRPSWAGGDEEAALIELQRAVDRAPQQLWRQVDLMRLVANPQGDEALIADIRAALQDASPTTPEDLAAVEWLTNSAD